MKLSGAILALAVAASPLGVCSCMLLFQGTSEEVTVTSEPPGATVTLNNGETRVTPFTITVPRKQDLQLHFSKAGYQSADLVDGSQVEGLIVIDVIPLMIPWAVDASAGAGFAHQQTALYAHLDPVAGAGGDAQSISDAPSPAKSKAAASDTQITP
jgi:PEGA domain